MGDLEGVSSSSIGGTAAATATALRRSCQHCRKRKIKCIPGPSAHSCKACTSKAQPCVFEKQSQMGRPPKSKVSKLPSPPEERLHALSSSSSSSSGSSSHGGGVATHRKKNSSKRASSPSGSLLHAKRTKTEQHEDAFHQYQQQQQHQHQHRHQHHHVPSSHPHFSHSATPTSGHHGGALNAAHFTASASARSSSDLPFLLNSTTSSYNPPYLSSSSLASVLPQHHYNPSASSSSAAYATTSSNKALCVQTQADPFPSFRNDSLHALASAFHDILSSSSSSSLATTSAPILSDPNIPPMARIRTLAARATATRKPLDRGPHAATPTYARSLISPLWDGLPVDIIALTTTGKPSASGPFSIASETSKRSSSVSGSSASAHGHAHAHDEYLYIKLLREDESSAFKFPASTPSPSTSTSSSGNMVFPRDSPGFKYAPDKMTVGKFFTGYFSKHPLAPLILNERLFLDDLMSNKVDPLLLHVIVGSSIARAPCLGAGDDDAEDVGDEFFRYVERELLSRQLEGACDMQTCQSLMLWATHELTHMRVRRANALFSTADIILRQRIQMFQARVEEEAAFARMQQEGRNVFGHTSPTPLGWRDLVAQELAVNALWVIVIWNTWASLSLKLPHNTTSIMVNSLPAPPQSIQLSSSFAFAYSAPTISSSLQPIVRRTIERFADMTQLINVIVTLKNQTQAKGLFSPDPPRPLAVIDDEEAQIATWLVDLAKFYNKSEGQDANHAITTGQHQMSASTKFSDSSRSFLVASHAVLALHQILPYATNASNSYGSPLPLPTIESLRTALTALHLVARSIQVSTPGSRTRTQAILLDAMPRILSLLDVFTSSSLSSLDHFVLVTSQRQLVHELLDDLNRAIACMNSPTARTPSLDNCGLVLEKSSRSLRTVVDIEMQLQPRPEETSSIHQSYGHMYTNNHVAGGSIYNHIESRPIVPAAAPGTPSTPASSNDSAAWHGSYQDYSATAVNHTVNEAGYNGSGGATCTAQPQISNGLVPNATMFGNGSINAQYVHPDHFSMSSHLANSPLLRGHDRTVATSPSYVGSLHAFL